MAISRRALKKFTPWRGTSAKRFSSRNSFLVSLPSHVLCPSSRSKALVNFRYAAGQLSYIIYKDVAGPTEHMGKVGLCFPVDGDAEGMDRLPACFDQGLARVLNAVLAFVAVPILGFAVRSRLSVSRVLASTFLNSSHRVPYKRPHPGIILRLDSGNALFYDLAVGLIESFYAVCIAAVAGHARKSVNGVPVAQGFRASDISTSDSFSAWLTHPRVDPLISIRNKTAMLPFLAFDPRNRYSRRGRCRRGHRQRTRRLHRSRCRLPSFCRRCIRRSRFRCSNFFRRAATYPPYRFRVISTKGSSSGLHILLVELHHLFLYPPRL